MSDNGHLPDGVVGTMQTPADVPCAVCGVALPCSAKFCSECGTQCTTTASPSSGGSTATDTSADEGDTTVTTGEFEITALATEEVTGLETAKLDESISSPPALAGDPATKGHVEVEVQSHHEGEVTAGAMGRRAWLKRPWVWVALVAVAAGSAGAGWAAFEAAGRRPVVAAAAFAAGEFTEAVGAVAASEDLEGLQAAVEELPGWIHAIDDRRSAMQSVRPTDLHSAVDRLLTAEAAYLSALRPLADLNPDDLSGWTAVSENIYAAGDELTSAHSTVASIDPAAAKDSLVDAVPATSSAELVVAATTADRATSAVHDVIATLRSSQRLADVRAGGEMAATEVVELQGALEILDGLSDAATVEDRLTLQAAFLDEASQLQSLTDETLRSWESTSLGLAQRGDTMVAGLELSSSDKATLTTDLRKMRASLDAVVADGQRRLKKWRRQVRQVKERRDTELASLSQYESGYRTQMQRYDDLRDQTADFTARIESSSVSYSEAYDAFYDGIAQRGEVRDAMNALSPPDAVRASHLAVVRVIDDAIAAMEAAIDGIAESQYCYYCYYAETDGWRRFQAESDRITDQFASVTSDWDAAVSGRRSELQEQPLPKKPVI